MTLPPGLEDAFSIAAGELGHVSASWLFLREVTRDWPEGGKALRDVLGRAYPVMDAVAAQAEAGKRAPDLEVARVAAALQGCRKVVVVGLEVDFLDALVPALPDAQLALLTHSSLPVDFERVLANYRGRLTAVDLSHFQSWAGSRSALLTFAYGTGGTSTHVSPQWLRVMGADTRTQFRSLIAWEALQGPLLVFPRWLEQVEADLFTDLV